MYFCRTPSLIRTLRAIGVPSSSTPRRAAEARQGAVIDHGEDGRGDFLAQLAGEGPDVFGDVVGLQGVADGLVDEHAAPAVLHDHVHLAGRGVLGLEHGHGLAGAGPGRLLRRPAVEHLEAGMGREPLPAHVRGAARSAQGLDDEEEQGQLVAKSSPSELAMVRPRISS